MPLVGLVVSLLLWVTCPRDWTLWLVASHGSFVLYGKVLGRFQDYFLVLALAFHLFLQYPSSNLLSLSSSSRFIHPG